MSNRIAGLVLAAGCSSRMQGENKLGCQLGSKTMLEHVLLKLQKSRLERVYVVLGHQAHTIDRQNFSDQIVWVVNERYQSGISSSVAKGIAAIEADSMDAAMIMPADMPFISDSTLEKLIAQYERFPNIIMPTYQGVQGNPLIWARKYFTVLQQLSGDVGAKSMFQDYVDETIFVETDDLGVLVDIDEPHTLAYYRSRLG